MAQSGALDHDAAGGAGTDAAGAGLASSGEMGGFSGSSPDHTEQADILKPFASLKLPPEQEQGVLRVTLNAALSHKLKTAERDLGKLVSVRQLLEGGATADESLKKALEVRFEGMMWFGKMFL